MAEITEKVKDFFTDAEVNIDILKAALSEFLAVELGGQKLYERALKLVSDPEVQTRFREYHRQTLDHQRVLIGIIHKLDGNPRLQSATAKVAGEKARALLRTMGRAAGLSKDERQLNAIENIVLAETKDHADWELIGKIARQTTDSKLRELLGAAAKTVEQEEDEHLNWTRKKLGELKMASLAKGDSIKTAAKRVMRNTSKPPMRVALKGPARPKSKPKSNGKSHGPATSTVNGRRPSAR
jgi:bacterioferritin (cytochrome b1)